MRILKGLQRNDFVSADCKEVTREFPGSADSKGVSEKESQPSWGRELPRPSSVFLLGVVNKGVRVSVNPLNATLVGWFVSVASKGFAEAVARLSAALRGWSGLDKRQAARLADESRLGCGLVHTRKNSTTIWIG